MTADVRHQYVSEETMLCYVHGGVLRVDPDGSVWRCRMWQTGRGYAKWIPCDPPSRAEIWCRDIVKVPACRDAVQYVCPVARVVWRVLRGAIPERMKVFHRDGDSKNNHPDNLYLAYGYSHSRRPHFADVDHRLFDFCRSPREMFLLNAVLTHGSQCAAAEAIGYHQSEISRCLIRLRQRAKDSTCNP